jgi:hypothetical protein
MNKLKSAALFGPTQESRWQQLHQRVRNQTNCSKMLSRYSFLICHLVLLSWANGGLAFLLLSPRHCSLTTTRLFATADDSTKSGNITDSNDGKTRSQNKKGYQFGDLTERLINGVTGKDDYKFGDLSKWLDSQAKQKAKEFTSKEEYKFGDISREMVRKIGAGEYTQDDLLLLLKLILTVGIQFQPIARILPVKALVQMLNLSMSQKLGDRVQHILAQELDKRMKEMMSGDVKQKFTRQAILKFIGKEKETYQFGDITKSMLQLGVASKNNEIVVGAQMKKELEEWDAAHPLTESDISNDNLASNNTKKK